MRSGGILAAWAALLFASAPAAADEAPICAGRPGKANPSCTVPTGLVQVETGLADWSRDRSGGIRTDSVDIGATAVKFGLSDRLHVEFNLPAYGKVRVRSGGLVDRVSGVGDAGVAIKYKVSPADGPVQASLYPFVKIPTANHSLGNGKVEGGMALLLDSTFPRSSVGWNIAPEVDLVADSDHSGYHLATVQVASVGVPVSDRLTVSAELWGSWDFDPAETVRQFSVDGAAAYLVSRNVQIDAGANLGLNRNTPDVEFYSGVAFRF